MSAATHRAEAIPSEAAPGRFPYDPRAEEAVLGAVVMATEAYHRTVAGGLVAEDFYIERNRRLWQVFGDLITAGKPVDPLSLYDTLGDDFDAMGGVRLFGALGDAIPSSAGVWYYADIVKRKALARRLQVAAIQADQDISDGADLGDVLTEIRTAVGEVETRCAPKTVRPVSAFADDLWAKVAEARERPGANPGLATGFIDVDTRLGGLRPGELIVVAGRPSMGKTAYMLAIAWHVAQVAPVLVHSLEQTSLSLSHRLAALLARVDADGLRRGTLRPEEYARVADAIGQIAACDRLLLDERPGVAIEDAAAQVRQLHRDQEVAVVFSDYLQIFRHRARFDSRDQAVGYVAQTAKDTAKELQIPWVVLAQVKRDVETRSNKRPGAADIRESGAVEQIADVIQTLYRDEVYTKDTTDKGIGEVHTVKNREGRVGHDRLAFVGAETRWANLEDARAPAPGQWESWLDLHGGSL